RLSRVSAHHGTYRRRGTNEGIHRAGGAPSRVGGFSYRGCRAGGTNLRGIELAIENAAALLPPAAGDRVCNRTSRCRTNHPRWLSPVALLRRVPGSTSRTASFCNRPRPKRATVVTSRDSVQPRVPECAWLLRDCFHADARGRAEDCLRKNPA